MSTADGHRLGRDFFARESDVVARELLGRVVRTGSGESTVAVRLTETEAYHGATDAASHAYRGETARTAVMFGPAGHLYLYFVYGMHWCANVVTGQPGTASAVLLRAGEVVDGVPLAQARRPAERSTRKLASGPARLAAVLGWGTGDAARAANGRDLCAAGGPGEVLDAPVDPFDITTGPRVGVAAAAEEPLRFWISGDPTVSAYRPRVPRPRNRGTG
ncbi:DNA-3-methyladenine glycosylase [Nakamurella deserti]|uniref:DNA-3-methyladenine glycosylase n=1 Tax=Nakamurella deserti TaxID=2164074 RepID=UPI000DBE9734|nr:DNA-3-methyladenine glycosylase [Nakamurella deserti]